MYCADTLQRLNDAKVTEYQEQLITEREERERWENLGIGQEDMEPEPESTKCEFCDDNPAVYVIPVYNPADKINGRGQEACAVYYLCDDCFNKDAHMEGNFYCDAYGERFIYNHSWEVLAVTDKNGIYCQSCAALDAEEKGVYLCDLLDILERNLNKTCTLFQKLARIPGKSLLWSGEFSEYSDFPGFTSFSQVGKAIREAAEEAGVEPGTMVWPTVGSGRQFSATLQVYY